MSWVVLILSGFLETVWAIALSASKGFSKPIPSAVFAVTLPLSMGGLAIALRSVPVGTGYVVWVGIGAVGTVVVGMVWLGETASMAKLLCLLAVIGGIVGLKFLH